MSALRNQLRNRDPYYLMALLNNGESDDPLVRAAYEELSGRGALPEYAEGMFDVTSPGPGDVPDPLESSATPIAPDPMVEDLPIYGRKVVGPRTPLGGDPAPGATMHSQKEVDDYYKRGIDPKTGDMIPSGADRGMLERGFRVVMGADGRPTYMMASDTTGMSQGLTGSAPIQAAEQRRLVTGNEGEKPIYWEPGTRRGLDGGSVDVLVPTQANKDYNARLNERRQKLNYLDRMERDTGVRPTDIPATQEERYFAEENARRSSRAQAAREWRQMAKSVGGSQNINSSNEAQIRALVKMERDDPEAYRRMQAENMRPRNVQYRFNPRTGQVEMTSEVAYEPPARGAGTEVNVNPTPLEQSAIDARERETNPMAAGDKDIRGGNYNSQQAGQVLDELAAQFDSGGWNTMSAADEAAFRDHLVTTYDMKPDDAARVAKKHADKRRWSWLQGGGAADGIAPPEATGPGGLRVPPGSTPYRTGA